jgi:protein-tyrosine phosphatase
MGRHLDWEGTFNARDLGGLSTRDGGSTAWGAIVRSDTPDRLTEGAWAQVAAHGVRTILDLRTTEERERRPYEPPEDIEVVALPIEDGLEDDPEFRHWETTGLLATPLYYREFLERWPERCASAVRSVAQARPGGVLMHCVYGRDRAGLLALLLLGLVGVGAEDIAEDHAMSQLRLRQRGGALGYPDDSIWVEALLEGQATTARDAVVDLVRSVDLEAYLKSAGVEEDDRVAVRDRLVVTA